MKIFSLILFNLMLSNSASFAADPKPKTMTPEMQAEMKLWEEASMVNEKHKVFAPLAGNWNYVTKWWKDGIEQTDHMSSGKSKMMLLLGGRFLQQDASGKAMGQKFEGRGFLGYNNLMQKYESIWMDSMSTGMAKGTGSYDAASKIIKENGEYSDPTAVNKVRNYTAEWKLTDQNNFSYSMITSDKDGKNQRKMEMVYTRIK